MLSDKFPRAYAWFRGDVMPENKSYTYNPGEPDHIVVLNLGGTKYTVREFFDTKTALGDVIARRVLRDLNPQISIKDNLENA
jgi:hypothetical protein